MGNVVKCFALATRMCAIKEPSTSVFNTSTFPVSETVSVQPSKKKCEYQHFLKLLVKMLD